MKWISRVLLATVPAMLLLQIVVLAQIVPNFPFQLQNNTTADATQVMANFNTLLNGINQNAAHNGANSDITSLGALTTPLSPAQGGTSVFTGGTAGGSANAITVTASPASFTLTPGYKIVFISSGINLPGGTTLNVSGTGVKQVVRLDPTGISSMGGGEIVAGQVVEMVYNGTQYQMTSLPAIVGPIGSVFDYATGGGCPPGSLVANGSNQVTATYPGLSSAMSVTWGNPGGGNFTLPDLRGRATFSADSTLGRITVAGGNFDGSAVGNVGGQQNQVLTVTQLPAHTHGYSGTTGGGTTGGGTTGVGTTGVGTTGINNVDHTHGAGAGAIDFLGISGTVSFNVAAGTINIARTSQTGGQSTTHTHTIPGLSVPGLSVPGLSVPGLSFSGTTDNGTGSGVSHPVLSNAAIVLKCVKT